jgi:hypothetical protein
MRWTLISIAVAIALIVFGIYITGPENMNIAQKCTYWFVVVGFLVSQAVHAMSWMRKHDL